MASPQNTLDYALPPTRHSQNVSILASAPLIGALLYILAAGVVEFSPHSLVVDRWIGASARTAFFVKTTLFALVPAMCAITSVLAIRRARRRQQPVVDICIGSSGILLSVFLFTLDFASLCALYRGYF